MHITDHSTPCYNGPSAAAGPEYARYDGLEAFATVHDGRCHAVEAAASLPGEPTQTVTYRKKYARRLRGRLAEIRSVARLAIAERDVFGLRNEALVSEPGSFNFDHNADKEEAFRGWFDSQADREIVEQFGGENELIRSGYERGVKDANIDLREAGRVDGLPETDISLRRPVHRDTLEAVYTRNFRALEGMTADIGRDLSRELSEGLAAGESADDVAARIVDTVGQVDDGTPRGAMARATAIARTELMNAHHEGQLTQYEQFGVEQIVPVLAPGACELCQTIDSNAPYGVGEAHAILPAHVNCVCSWTLYTGS